MKKIIILLVIISHTAFAQNSSPIEPKFCDMHMHLSLKKYMANIIVPDSILKYVDENGILTRTPNIPEFERINWKPNNDNIRKMKKGKTSNFKNYIQGDYYKMSQTNYDIVCESLMALEKNTVNNGFKRLLNKNFATHIDAKKLKSVNNTDESYHEMLAQYYFITSQIEGDDNTKQKAEEKGFMVVNDTNDIKIARAKNATSVVLTIEGGNSLYGSINSKNVLGNGIDSCMLGWENEILQHVDSIKNLNHRILFIGLTHFSWTRIAGHAKAVDKNNFFQRWIASTLSRTRSGHKSLHNKWGQGLIDSMDIGKGKNDNCKCFGYEPNKHTNIGKNVVNKLLTPEGKFRKPIYIDVRHMDVKARLDYYSMLDSIFEADGRRIPIIMSHGAVSGEKLSIALPTGSCPLYDRYPEVKRPLDFYKKQSEYYGCFPKEDINDSTAGLFYPWSVNLYDEEIERIYDSNGMIGLIFYSLPLGADMKKNKSSKHKKEVHKKFKTYQFNENDLKDYLASEAFIRNMFYISEMSGRKDSTAWDHICLGSDFDSGEDPIDIAPTALDMKSFYTKLPLLIDIFCKIEGNGKDKFKYNLTSKEIVEKVFHKNMARFVWSYL